MHEGLLTSSVRLIFRFLRPLTPLPSSCVTLRPLWETTDIRNITRLPPPPLSLLCKLFLTTTWIIHLFAWACTNQYIWHFSKVIISASESQFLVRIVIHVVNSIWSLMHASTFRDSYSIAWLLYFAREVLQTVGFPLYLSLGSSFKYTENRDLNLRSYWRCTD